MATLSDLSLDNSRGFLPSTDPTLRLSEPFRVWDEIGANLPKLLVSDKLRSTVEKMPLLDGTKVSDADLHRAMLVLSYIGHAYVWGDKKPGDTLPKTLALPWWQVSERLGRPPVLSYESYALDNWKRIDPNGPIQAGNIALLQNFLGGIDEEWFIIIHVDIEAKAAAALAGALDLHSAVSKGDAAGSLSSLTKISNSLDIMYASLDRMPEHCDPYIYYNRVRPYIHGWKNHPILTEGVKYEGVVAYGGKPQQFRGETGAQSSIIPALDGALGIGHKEGFLNDYLMEMRDYMPRKHRAFIEHLEKGPKVREFLSKQDAKIKNAYNSCVDWIEKFRTKHLEYAVKYIENQSQTSAMNPTKVGTGGTPFVPYLTKHRDETTDHKL